MRTLQWSRPAKRVIERKKKKKKTEEKERETGDNKGRITNPIFWMRSKSK